RVGRDGIRRGELGRGGVGLAEQPGQTVVARQPDSTHEEQPDQDGETNGTAAGIRLTAARSLGTPRCGSWVLAWLRLGRIGVGSVWQMRRFGNMRTSHGIDQGS